MTLTNPRIRFERLRSMRWVADDDPSGGNPYSAMAAMPLREWTRRLGASPAEAYDCFMVGTYMGSTEYKRGSRAVARGQ